MAGVKWKYYEKKRMLSVCYDHDHTIQASSARSRACVQGKEGGERTMRPARELPWVRKSSARMAAARSAETPSLAWRNSSMLRLRAGPRPVSPGYRVSSRSAAERDTANRSQNVT